MTHPFASTLKTFSTASGKTGQFWSLPALSRRFPGVKRMPVSLRIVLESVLRNCDGRKVTADDLLATVRRRIEQAIEAATGPAPGPA